MALKGIDVNETVEFIPKCERGQENPTTFLIGVLRNKDKMKLGGSVYMAADKGMKQAEMAWEMVKTCVKKIKNLIDPKTQKLTDYDEVTDEVLCMLGTDIVMEVAEKISEFNKLTEGEQGN